MDKEQLLLEITKLEVMNQQIFEIIKGYQAQIQANLKKQQVLEVQLNNLRRK